MKQVLQNLGNGETLLQEVPCPSAKPGQLVIRTTTSLISSGTERMLVDFAKGGLIEKARQQPEKVKQVLDKVRTDGLLPTYEAVRSQLDQPLPLGYCNVGVVMEVGAGVTGYAVGDRVVSNGNHAEIVQVPRHLCAKIPQSVTDEQAAFTVLGAIALQGIRLLDPTLGERVVVTGLGLLGLLSVQILRANGCEVLGIDFDSDRCALAREYGAETVDLSKGEDPVAKAQEWSSGVGVDGVLITAATQSNEPVHQAAVMSRKRGRIVLVGVTGLQLSRNDFFEKELTFQVSCSYGPGRYDEAYEQKGQDYPLGFVRWTENRNFEAILGLMKSGQLQSAQMISHRFDFDNAPEAYRVLSEESSSMGMLLQYGSAESADSKEFAKDMVSLVEDVEFGAADPVLSFIGAGNYGTRMLMPAFKKAGAQFNLVASTGAVAGVYTSKMHGFSAATTDSQNVIDDEETNLVVIATRHDTHADFVCKALEAGKHVFVEKPLAIDEQQLQKIETQYKKMMSSGHVPQVLVGFNRRFSPQVQKIKKLLKKESEPKVFLMTVNAGDIPADHWTQDLAVGGGRIIGEGCHFIDLLRFLAGAPIIDVKVSVVGSYSGVRSDKVSFTLSFADGSMGTVHYLANGSKSFPKERLEVFCGGQTIQLDNFRKMKGFDWSGFNKMNLVRQDKGQSKMAELFLQTLREGGQPLIPFTELLEVTRVSFQIAEQLKA